MIRNAIVAISVTFFICIPAVGQESRIVDEFEIDASVDDVWNAFTTSEGLKSWVAPLADIDLRVGGKWRANYNKDGKLGDETTIENTILCYDPKRMLSIKATKFPKGFEFEEAAKETWSIFYFAKVEDTKTKITIVGLGYNDSEQSRKMRAFFKPANKYSMDQLKAALKNRPDKKKNDESASLVPCSQNSPVDCGMRRRKFCDREITPASESLDAVIYVTKYRLDNRRSHFSHTWRRVA